VLTPGYRTTEFLIVALTILGQLVAALTDHLSPHWAAIASSVAAGAYALARGLAKLNPPKDSGTATVA
jgi:hypothetical protein